MRANFQWLAAAALVASAPLASCTKRGSTSASRELSTEGRWAGRFSPAAIIQTGVLGATASGKNHGDVFLRPFADQPGRVRYDLVLAVPMAATRQVAWAVLDGRCDMTGLPAAAAIDFPVIDIGLNGDARLSGEMTLPLEPRREYHVNLYLGRRASEGSRVLMCANLRYDGQR